MEVLSRLVTMLRLLAFMVLIYVLLAWMVERNSQNPQSKVRAFFRILCLPVTAIVRRYMPGAPEERVLRASAGAVGAVWLLLIALDELLLRSQ